MSNMVRWSFELCRLALSRLAGPGLLLTGAMVSGCLSTEDSRPDRLGAQQAGPSDAALEGCEEGDQRPCSVTLADADGTLACFQGVQRCQDGGYGECVDGATVRQTGPDGGSHGHIELRLPGQTSLDTVSSALGTGSRHRPYALSEQTDCATNPCNPFCQEFKEEPIDPWVTKPGLPEGLQSGDPGSVPLGSECAWGADCQYNQRCTEPVTASVCGHSKCETGAALGSSCRTADACVDAVCDLEPACCSTNWGASCVAKVKSACDAFCGSPPPSCEHHVCDVGSALTCDNACVNTVCAIDGSCCESGWTSHCVDLATSECGSILPAVPPVVTGYEALCQYSAYAYDNLYLGQKSHVAGRLGSGLNMEIVQSNISSARLLVSGNLILDNAVVSGSAVVKGWVELRNAVTFSTPDTTPVLEVGGTTTIAINTTRLTGNVIANTSPSLGGAAATPPVWTGTRITPTAAPSVPRPAIPTKTGLTCSSTNHKTVNPGSTLDLPPGAYGTLTMNSNATSPAVLRLHPGTYTFASVTMNADSRLELDYGTAGIDINVCNTMILGNRLVFSPQPADFSLLRWYYHGSAATTIDQQASTSDLSAYIFPGMITAPNAQVTIAPNTALGGVIFAKSLRFEPGLHLLPANYADLLCGTTGSPVCDDAIDLSVPSVPETGTCVPQELGATDSACTGYDLALGVPCDKSFVVCNHGLGQAPANVRLAFFRTSYTFGTTTPNTSSAAYVGECEVSVPIPSGTCVNQLCDASLLTSDRLVVAIPPTSSPAECSTLDNWTRFDDSSVCACFWDELPAESLDPSAPETCEVPIGDASSVDLSATSVTLVTTSGSMTSLTRRDIAAECGEGYVLNGATITLCPDTCQQVALSPGAIVKTSVACAIPRLVTQLSEQYEVECPNGTAPHWDMLMWDATTPEGASIDFEVRLATTPARLVESEFVTVGTARQDGEVDTQRCDAFNPSSECPVLFQPLVDSGVWSTGEIYAPTLELRATLQPSTTTVTVGPTLTDWELLFSCLESE